MELLHRLPKIIVLLWIAGSSWTEVKAFGSHHQPSTSCVNDGLAKSQSQEPSVTPILVSNTRRALLLASLSTLAVATAHAYPAAAVKPRNEALCSTGLFDNFMEYRCTPIGNIQDEGQSKDMTSTESASTDSLMSKLGLSNDETSSAIGIADDSTSNGKKSSGSMSISSPSK